ncbi:class I SAM-dependent methyltransferase [Risungbinella massiliensis]|uniref:class I SAM-dependent methyltransferase n=1 Tax=Risungbinella massiliensis TaxID=1329796 RepID=UPI0005CC0D77|nr:methyltransferase [Risungbinella massiliensis]
MIQQVADKVRFFYSFVKSPKTVGSITPSSSFLTKRIFRDVNWENAQTVVELGAGTGVFTEWISQRLPAHAAAFIFERDDHMRSRLSERFQLPNLQIADDGLALQEVLCKQGLDSADYIISSLPFANFSQELRTQFLDTIQQTLRPGGLFIAYQYSRQMESQLRNVFTNVETSLVPINLPPAFVYTCKK